MKRGAVRGVISGGTSARESHRETCALAGRICATYKRSTELLRKYIDDFHPQTFPDSCWIETGGQTGTLVAYGDLAVLLTPVGDVAACVDPAPLGQRMAPISR
jgi:hypothetical protein